MYSKIAGDQLVCLLMDLTEERAFPEVLVENALRWQCRPNGFVAKFLLPKKQTKTP